MEEFRPTRNTQQRAYKILYPAYRFVTLDYI